MTTRAATETLAWLRSERDFWHARANDDDLHTYHRQAAIARRDQLDMIMQRIPRMLRDIEAEAENHGAADALWLDKGAGLPA